MSVIKQYYGGWTSTHETSNGPALWYRYPNEATVLPTRDGWAILYKDGTSVEGIPTAEECIEQVMRVLGDRHTWPAQPPTREDI